MSLTVVTESILLLLIRVFLVIIFIQFNVWEGVNKIANNFGSISAREIKSAIERLMWINIESV